MAAEHARNATKLVLAVGLSIGAVLVGCSNEVADGGGTGGATSSGGVHAGGTGEAAGQFAGLGGTGNAPGGAGGGHGGGTGGSALSSCSPAPPCGPNELPVRVILPALGSQQCTCVQNPRGNAFPTCNCAQPVCASYYATCSSYAPDSGYLVCVQPG
jgi:hypothetical protein